MYEGEHLFFPVGNHFSVDIIFIYVMIRDTICESKSFGFSFVENPSGS